MTTRESLPTELLIIIFGYLDSSRAIGECRLVCKAWDEPAAISMLKKPIAIEDYDLANDFVEYLESHSNKGQHVRHLTVYNHYGNDLLQRMLQQAFNPNIEQVDIGGYDFQHKASLSRLYDYMISIATQSNVKFDKLKKISHKGSCGDRYDKGYGRALRAFNNSIQSATLSFYKIDEVDNVIHHLGELTKLSHLKMKGYFNDLGALDAVLKGCHHLKHLDLIVEEFLGHGDDYDWDDPRDPEHLLDWEEEDVEQVISVETMIFSGWGYAKFIEYLAFKYPNTTTFIYDIFRLSTAYENIDDSVSKNIEQIFDALKHSETLELHYQIPPGDDLEEVCQAAQGNLNSMRLRYTELGGMDTMHMHLTSTLSKNGTRSTEFDVEIPLIVDNFHHVELIQEARIPLHRLELDFLNFGMQKMDPFYRAQLQVSEETGMFFDVLRDFSEIKQIKVLGHSIDGTSNLSSMEDEILLESLEFCGAQVTEDALQSIAQDCQRLNTLILTNCQLVPDDHNMYHIKMHPLSFYKFKLHLVPVDDIALEQKGIRDDANMHAEDYVYKVWKSMKKIWSEPCYLWLAIFSANKKIYYEIIPGERNYRLISKETFDARYKGSYVLHFNCNSLKSLEIDIGASKLSLGEQSIAAALNSHLSCVLEQDDMVEEDDFEDE